MLTTMPTLLLNLWLPWAILYAILAINSVLEVWVLRILYQQRVWKELPWFVAYVAFELLSTILSLTTSFFSGRAFVTASWCAEAVRVVLILVAVRESLLRIFEQYRPLLARSVLAVIAIIILYSARKTVYFPPAHSSPLVSFILAAEFAFRWGITAVSILSIFLMMFLQEPMGSREDAVITGCGIASTAVVLGVLSRSFFGTSLISVTQYLSDLGYFIACWWWIRFFSRPVQQIGFKELRLGPDGIRRELRSYREILDEIVRTLR